MPLNHPYTDAKFSFILYENVSFMMKTGEIIQILYSAKTRCDGYHEHKLYHSIEISLIKENEDFYFELCPLREDYVENYVGRTYSYFTMETQHDEIRNDQIHYYNEILNYVENFVLMSIEEFTHGSFNYIE